MLALKMAVLFCNQPWLKSFADNPKGQLYSEEIHEVIVSPKMLTKKLKYFCTGSLLEYRADILQILDWHFRRNDDLINLF